MTSMGSDGSANTAIAFFAFLVFVMLAAGFAYHAGYFDSHDQKIETITVPANITADIDNNINVSNGNALNSSIQNNNPPAPGQKAAKTASNEKKTGKSPGGSTTTKVAVRDSTQKNTAGSNTVNITVINQNKQGQSSNYEPSKDNTNGSPIDPKLKNIK